jgi:hypothetical protein
MAKTMGNQELESLVSQQHKGFKAVSFDND